MIPRHDGSLLPGSDGEHELQEKYGTAKRAGAFYDKQVLDRLNAPMREFIAEQEMFFVATSDSKGECDSSLRSGPAGFVHCLDERTLIYPEYRGNGVMASLGNISENPHVGIFFVDFFRSTIGLHVNGGARIVENADLPTEFSLPREVERQLVERGGRAPERWVCVAVEEAYIHCSKHIPRLQRLDKEIHWGTDDERQKGGNYFRVREPRATDSNHPQTHGPQS
ncbi:MAG: pyridoxamine 5'-phosphate oxidase family protein [Planctomycetota bacterium]